MRFTTNAYPREQRRDAWRFALQRLSITLEQVLDDPYGELVHFRSGQGIDFIRLTGTAQGWALEFSEGPGGLWPTLMVDGSARVTTATGESELVVGDLLAGRGG